MGQSRGQRRTRTGKEWVETKKKPLALASRKPMVAKVEGMTEQCLDEVPVGLWLVSDLDAVTLPPLSFQSGPINSLV